MAASKEGRQLQNSSEEGGGAGSGSDSKVEPEGRAGRDFDRRQPASEQLDRPPPPLPLAVAVAPTPPIVEDPQQQQ
jgi:hypothetical protein